MAEITSAVIDGPVGAPAAVASRRHAIDTVAKPPRPTPQMRADALERGMVWGVWELVQSAQLGASEPEVPSGLRRLAQFRTGQKFAPRILQAGRLGADAIRAVGADWSREAARYPESTTMRAARERREVGAH